MSAYQVCLLLLASALLPTVATDVPCAYEACDCSAVRIDCSYNGNLTALPPLEDGNFTQIYLYLRNNITTIKVGQLPGGLELFQSYLTPLATIEDHAFKDSASTLTGIIMNGNHLQHVPDLSQLTKLRSVSIVHTFITNVDQYCLPYSLDSLYLGFNSLTSIPDLSHIKYLNTLDVGSNSLTSIPDLSHMFHLRSLSLPGNAIVDSDTVSLPASLHKLVLDHNYLSRIPNIPHLTRLKTLSLAFNNITDSPTARLPYSLQSLVLTNNSLTHIPVTVSSLVKLTDLELAYNQIVSIDSFIFPSSLQTLNLNFNPIKSISMLYFPNNASDLTSLYLSGTSLNHIANDAFSQMSKLSHVFLSDTALTRLPLALHSLTHVAYLDLHNNHGLTCTCQESSLAAWYGHMAGSSVPHQQQMYLAGDCQSYKISYFLGTLAKNCPPPELTL